MKMQFTNDVIQKMLPYLDNDQADKLKQALLSTLAGYEINESSTSDSDVQSNQKLVDGFLAAKRIEGCSEKSMLYYKKTIETMISAIGKTVSHITTDDLRSYLTSYQAERSSSKVTIDNIRRILSSFFSWLEDEDYILKSPVRRIHKVKSASTIKETYSDEALALNSRSPRQSAMCIVPLRNMQKTSKSRLMPCSKICAGMHGSSKSYAPAKVV